MLHRRIIAPALLAVVLGACGSATQTATPAGPSGTADPTTTDPTTTSSTTSPDDAGRGWIGGEPDWDQAYASGGGDAMPMSAAPAEADTAESAASDVGPSGAPIDSGPLRAGSVDDNADFAGFLDYLARYEELGLPARPFDPAGRIVLTLTGANTLPVAGAAVTVSQGDATVAALRTSADGQAIFLPAEYDLAATDAPTPFTFGVGGVSVDAIAGNDAALSLPTDGGAVAGMPADVLFLLDVTGSMGDEIAQLKATIAQVSAQLEALPQQPDIRFGMTLFRDEGDLFVTSTFDFTDDISTFQTALDGVEADGGGDTPEAVDEAFAAALGDPSWRDPASTVQMIFLVGDAAPQVGRQVEQTYPQSILEASSRGITVHVVAASQTDDPAEHTFREIAQGTGGRFVFLAYGAAGTATGEHTDIASTDYEELSLDQLVVRLVGEELAALTGETFTPPAVADTVPTTDGQGQ